MGPLGVLETIRLVPDTNGALPPAIAFAFAIQRAMMDCGTLSRSTFRHIELLCLVKSYEVVFNRGGEDLSNVEEEDETAIRCGENPLYMSRCTCVEVKEPTCEFIRSERM